MTADRSAKAGPDSLSSQPQLVNAARAFMVLHDPLHEVRRVRQTAGGSRAAAAAHQAERRLGAGCPVGM